MRYLDRWVSKRGKYLSEYYILGLELQNQGIQQVRKEISEFIRIILLKGLKNNILEIGLGYHGGTHMLWRHLFKQVFTIEYDPLLVKSFRQKE